MNWFSETILSPFFVLEVHHFQTLPDRVYKCHFSSNHSFSNNFMSFRSTKMLCGAPGVWSQSEVFFSSNGLHKLPFFNHDRAVFCPWFVHAKLYSVFSFIAINLQSRPLGNSASHWSELFSWPLLTLDLLSPHYLFQFVCTSQ